MKKLRFNPKKGAAMEMAALVLMVSVAFGALMLTYSLWGNEKKNEMLDSFSQTVLLDSVANSYIDELKDKNFSADYIASWNPEQKNGFSATAMRTDNTVTLRIADSLGSLKITVVLDVTTLPAKVVDWVY